MEVTITLIICLSVVFIITLGIVSCTLRDKNFKVRFDDRNKRLSRIIQEQRDELISYREAIKKNDANLERSLEVLASASDTVNKKNISFERYGRSSINAQGRNCRFQFGTR